MGVAKQLSGQDLTMQENGVSESMAPGAGLARRANACRAASVSRTPALPACPVEHYPVDGKVKTRNTNRLIAGSVRGAAEFGRQGVTFHMPFT